MQLVVIQGQDVLELDRRTFINGQRVWDCMKIDDSVRSQRLTFDR